MAGHTHARGLTNGLPHTAHRTTCATLLSRMTPWTKWVLVIAALVTLGIAVQQRHRVALKLQDPLGGHINDFDRWMIMIPQFIHQRADYVDDLFPMPPVSLFVLSPLTALSRQNAQFVWVCVKLPLACLVLALSTAMVARTGAQLTPSAVALILACWWLPIVLDMQQGQTNFLVLVPLVAALLIAQNDAPASDAIAGFLIGLAAAIKVTPLIFAAYFFWKRRWIVTLSAVASLGLWLLVVPAAVFGWDQNIRWLGQWVRIMIEPYVTRGEVLYPMSQSFGSFALRLLTALPVFETTDGGVPYGHYMNVLQLTETTVSRFAVSIMVVVAFAGLWWTRRTLATLKCRRYLLEVGAVTAFMLWFSERTWVHHYVTFVLTLCAAGTILSDATESDRTRGVVRLSLVSFAVVTLCASEVGRMFGPHGVERAQAAGVFLWPSIVVTITTIGFGGAPGTTTECTEDDGDH